MLESGHVFKRARHPWLPRSLPRKLRAPVLPRLPSGRRDQRGFAIITLNRPEWLNALNAELLSALANAVEE